MTIITEDDFRMVLQLIMPGDHDPYELYDTFRDRGPVRHALGSGWVLSSYADVLAVLRDDRFGQLGSGERPAASHPVLSFLAADPPDHDRLRDAASSMFTPPRVTAMRERITALLDEIVDTASASGTLDVAEDLGARLANEAIADIIGVPAEHRTKLHEWSNTMWIFLEPPLNQAAIEEGNQAVAEAHALFSELAAEARRHPTDEHLIGVLSAAVDDGVLTEHEMLASLVTIMVAGQETTVNLISNGTMALLEHPELLARLRDDPTLVKRAAEEMLRYDSPIQIVARMASTEIEVAGVTFDEGDVGILLLGGANRDPAMFPDPATLDFDRPNAKRHIGFGSGIHLCLGAFLARTEAELAFGRIVALDDLALAEGAERRPTSMLRGYAHLPVTFTP